METISVKLLLLCLLCCHWGTRQVYAQRIYMEQEMDRYNLLVELQEHLDTLRLKLGNDLKVTTFVAQKSGYSMDSIALSYNTSGKIIKTDWYRRNDDGFYLDVSYTHSYDGTGRLTLLEYVSVEEHYWSHRYELKYYGNGILASVTHFRFSGDRTDTNSRYLYHYQNGLADTVVYQGWGNGVWIDKNRKVYGWDANGRMIYENWESTATNGEFLPMMLYPKTYEYDSIGRLLCEFLPHGDNDTVRMRFKYEYIDGLKAMKYIEFVKDREVETYPDTYYWYNSDSLLLEELHGFVIKHIWQPTSRNIQTYYPNGLLESRITIAKWPYSVVWDHEEEVKRYYYQTK